MSVKFQAGHQALLFAWTAKSLFACCGEKEGDLILADALKIYGNQRGRRMALRAQANGDDLSFWNYLAYQEWSVPAGQIKKKINLKSDHLNAQFLKCPWVETWRENDLLDYGKYFCKYVDNALFEGFSPAINMQLRSNRSSGSDCCDFHFPDEKMSFKSALISGYKKMKHANTMPWEYHTGHLYWTLKRHLDKALGDNTIMQEALGCFNERFGAEAVKTVLSYEGENFDALPG